MNNNNKQGFVLVVEDDQNLRVAVSENLEAEGYDVMATGTVAKATEYVNKFSFDLIVLDITLPDGDGFSLCRQWRDNGIDAMILMLTARDAEDDMLEGFRAGTDDYIVKPYPLSVFLSRVEALFRRTNTTKRGSSRSIVQELELPGFDIDTDARLVTSNSNKALVALTKIEYDLLLYFIKNKNRALSYDEIISEVWGNNIHVVQGAIRNTVSSLRKVLENKHNSQLWQIVTLRGIGYRMEISED